MLGGLAHRDELVEWDFEGAQQLPDSEASMPDASLLRKDMHIKEMTGAPPEKHLKVWRELEADVRAEALAAYGAFKKPASESASTM
jgi:hypothetical protein